MTWSFTTSYHVLPCFVPFYANRIPIGHVFFCLFFHLSLLLTLIFVVKLSGTNGADISLKAIQPSMVWVGE